MMGNLELDWGDIAWLVTGFMLGALSRPVAVWLSNRVRHQHRAIPLPNARKVWVALITVVVMWSLWSTQHTQNDLRDAKVRESDCYTQFYRAITANRALNDQLTVIDKNLDRLDAADRKALFDYVVAIANPPANLVKLPADGPERVQYQRDLMFEYIGHLQATDGRREQLAGQQADLERQRQPYPEPTCGKG